MKQKEFDLHLKLTADELFILRELLINVLVVKKYQELIKDKEYGQLRKKTYKKIKEEIEKIIIF